jgi:hypothetical protein
MHCTILLSSQSCAFVIYHVESKLEEVTEQAQAEDLTNIAWIKASPSAFNQCSLYFILNHLFMFYLVVH